jgi:hypothetical protein
LGEEVNDGYFEYCNVTVGTPLRADDHLLISYATFGVIVCNGFEISLSFVCRYLVSLDEERGKLIISSAFKSDIESRMT